MRPPRRLGWFILVSGLIAHDCWTASVRAADFRAGASAVDVSPRKLPVLINGGFLQAQTNEVRAPLFARAIVLDDGATRLALVVVDSCMMPRGLLDRAKQLALASTGIPSERILISATHTHSAPAAMGALGCSADGSYVEFLPERIAESIERAVARLVPAQVGWGAVDEPEFTHCRRWIRRPDRMVVDPFGRATGRAHMHPGHQNIDALGPSGPVDPQLSILALRTRDGKPLALLANYSMHYYGDGPASPDYFGLFVKQVERSLSQTPGDTGCVAIMSQGTSGDQQWMDYGSPAPKRDIQAYASALAASAVRVFETIRFRDSASLAMAETTLSIQRRTPDAERLSWARPIVAALGDRPPSSIPEVYAREAIFLHDDPVRELKLQAIRIGELGITAIPNEVYALTGLKIKARSPLPSTFQIELANGSEGYIPPPEQHALGGYTTWPARTAALEVAAETRITETVLELLEKVSGRPRRKELRPDGGFATAVRAAKPWAFWQLDEMDGAVAHDSSGRSHDARLEPGFALYLPGRGEGSNSPAHPSRAIHLAGGRLVSENVPETRWTVELWFWNALPSDARDLTGVLVDGGGDVVLSIGGKTSGRGRLVVGPVGDRPRALGVTPIPTRSWHHLAVTLNGKRLSVDLDGHREIEEIDVKPPGSESARIALGGTNDPATRFEGKLDEVAVFDRALSLSEIQAHFRAERP